MCGMARRMLKEFKEVRKVSNTLPKVRTWLFLKTAICFFASLAAALLFRSRHGLHGVVAAFWFCLHFYFLRQSSRSFVFTLITIFCHFNIATMKMDVCVQATLCILKWDRSWGYTPPPPTENTLCKITVEPPLTDTPYSGHLAYAATWTRSRLKRY